MPRICTPTWFRQVDKIVTDLQRAISNGELTVQYQPIVELATSHVYRRRGAGPLVARGEVVPPREFLGAAEESGLIVRSASGCSGGPCRAPPGGASWDFGVWVNLSARQITAPVRRPRGLDSARPACRPVR